MIATGETVFGRSFFVLDDLERQVREFGTQEIFHFGRPLTVHLIETAKWLDTWGTSSTLVRADAFHNIYGTEEFREKAVSQDLRPNSRPSMANHRVWARSDDWARRACRSVSWSYERGPWKGSGHVRLDRRGRPIWSFNYGCGLC